MRKDGVGDARQEHALKRQRLLGTRASEREIVESDVQLGNSCLGFYLNQMDVVDDGRNGAHAPYVVSLAELFQDGRLLRGCSSGTCPVSRSGPSSDGAAPRRVSREPFPGITDALLANFVADYDASFFFDQCPSLYQTTGQLVLITGDAPSRIAALRGWVRDHLHALAERTRVLGVSGLFSGRAPSACEQGPDSLSARVDGAGGGGGGVHHSKFMILRLRDDRVRLVIHTSNDIAYDWFFKCQGIFAVDLPLRGAGSASPNTGFCADLQQYLGAYIRAGERALHGGVTSARRFGTMVAPGDAASLVDAVSHFRRLMTCCDYSAVDGVRLVSSVPGWHRISGQSRTSQTSRTASHAVCAFGHLRLANLVASSLRQCTEAARHPNSLAFVLQGSSLSSVDARCPRAASETLARYWLTSELFRSLCGGDGGGGGVGEESVFAKLAEGSAQVYLVWPTRTQVLTSIVGIDSGMGLIARAQAFLDPEIRQLLTRWNADWCARTSVMPHMKTISCWDTRTDQCLYCYLGSANVTPAAWGITQKQGSLLRCMNWELGVLFTSGYLATPKLYRELRHYADRSNERELNEPRSIILLPLPYTPGACAGARYQERLDQPWSSDAMI
jgi:hypothetical protein